MVLHPCNEVNRRAGGIPYVYGGGDAAFFTAVPDVPTIGTTLLTR